MWHSILKELQVFTVIVIPCKVTLNTWYIVPPKTAAGVRDNSLIYEEPGTNRFASWSSSSSFMFISSSESTSGRAWKI